MSKTKKHFVFKLTKVLIKLFLFKQEKTKAQKGGGELQRVPDGKRERDAECS